MKKLIILLLLLFLVGCTSIRVGDKIIKTDITVENANTTSNSTIAKITDIPSKYETPNMLKSRVLDETNIDDFGDVI